MSVDTRLLGECQALLPRMDWVTASIRYVSLVAVLAVPAMFLDFRPRIDDSEQSAEVISSFIVLTTILFAVVVHAKHSEVEAKQRNLQGQWNAELVRISGLVLDLELMCKKHPEARVLGFELIQDILAGIRSEHILDPPFTEHVDCSLKLQTLIEEWVLKADADPHTKLWKPFAQQVMGRFLESIHAVLDARFARHETRNLCITHIAWLQLCFLGSVLFWGVLQLNSSFEPFNTALPVLTAAMIGLMLFYLDYLDRFDTTTSVVSVTQLEDYIQQRMLVGLPSISNSHSSQRLAHPPEPTTTMPSVIDHFSTYPPRHTVTSLTSSLEMDQQSVASSNFTTTLEEVKHAL